MNTDAIENSFHAVGLGAYILISSWLILYLLLTELVKDGSSIYGLLLLEDQGYRGIRGKSIQKADIHYLRDIGHGMT